MRDIWFHITPVENVSSILNEGLILHRSQTSDQDMPLGHYISSNWIELIASGTYHEIFRYKRVVVLAVDVCGLCLDKDPEYHKDDDSDGFNVRVIKNMIVKPTRITVESELDMNYISAAMKSTDKVKACIQEYDRYQYSSVKWKSPSNYTDSILEEC